MRLFRSSLAHMSCCLALCLPVVVLGQDVQSKDPGTAATPSAAAASPSQPPLIIPASTKEMAAVEGLPESPGAEWMRLQEGGGASQQQAPVPAVQSADEKKDGKSQRPVGTAAAEAPKVTGITAAEPAGVAIAPAKQRRVRTIVLKVGAIVGAGAALGTVIALSAGTSSKPPGAH